MGQIEKLKDKLKERREQMGDAAFGHTAQRLPDETQRVLWRILGGSSQEEIVEEVALREFHNGSVPQPTEADLAAAKAKTRYILGEIVGRFNLVLKEDASSSVGLLTDKQELVNN